MILIDTHIWIWWVQDDPALSNRQRQVIQQNEQSGIGVSIFSCWEVSKLVSLNRLIIPEPVSSWLPRAAAYPGIRLIPLTVDICVEANRLPEPIHKDPADHILIATARVLSCPLLISDRLILSYPHVQTC